MTVRKVTNRDWVGHMSYAKVAGDHLSLESSVAHSGHRWWYFLALLDLFHQDLSNDIGGVIIRVLMYLFSLLFVHKLRWERKNKEIKEEKDLEGTLKLWWWYHKYNRNNLDKVNTMTIIKVINGDQSGSHKKSEP
jgi:hypothetical protein